MGNSQPLQRCIAPAKLNLFLHVTGRREDGYHCLQSLFLPIALYDELRLTVNDTGVVRRVNAVPGIAEEYDLVVRAARLLQAQFSAQPLSPSPVQYSSQPSNQPYQPQAQSVASTPGVDIHLTKQIPSGAGLGGGSSDAAAVLSTLNQQWGLGLSQQALAQLALRLGADVPFFLYGQQGQAAWVEGIGEQITPVSPALQAVLEAWHYVLFIPQIAIPTVSIFKDKRLCRDTPALTIEQFEQAFLESVAVLEGAVALEGATLEGEGAPLSGAPHKQVALFGRNDLEAVACAQYPLLAELVHWLGQQGVAARMSGAGSVFFAVCPSAEAAQQMVAEVTATYQQLPADNPLRALQLRCLSVSAHRA